MKVLLYGSPGRSGTHWFGHLLWLAFYRGNEGLSGKLRPSFGHRFKGHSRFGVCEWRGLFKGHYSKGIDIYLTRDMDEARSSSRRLRNRWIREVEQEHREEGARNAGLVIDYEDLKRDANGVMHLVAKTFGLPNPAFLTDRQIAMRVGYNSYDPADFYMDGDCVKPWWRAYYLEKLCLAQALSPVSRVVEIGVRTGYGARIFHEAWPDLKYTGFDAELDKPKLHAFGRSAIKALGGKYVECDTQTVDALPTVKSADFVHVDGAHTEDGVCHDIKLALQLEPKFILVDDLDSDLVHAGLAKSKVRYLRIPLADTPKEVALIIR